MLISSGLVRKNRVNQYEISSDLSMKNWSSLVSVRFSPPLKEILSGLSSIVNGLAGLSNQASDRHVQKCKSLPHHAHLTVNSSFTLCQFLLDVLDREKLKRVTP